jgi:hypothetical protein
MHVFEGCDHPSESIKGPWTYLERKKKRTIETVLRYQAKERTSSLIGENVCKIKTQKMKPQLLFL